MDSRPDDKERVDTNVSPIYQPLDPEWADTTLHDPLLARGWFSNAWVLYGEEDIPRQHRVNPRKQNPLAIEAERTKQIGKDRKH